MLKKEEMITLLKNDVVPALGCTEPVCVALCAANAGKMTENKIRSIEVDLRGKRDETARHDRANRGLHVITAGQ